MFGSRVDVGSLEQSVTVGVQNRSEVLVLLNSQETDGEDQGLKHMAAKHVPFLLHYGKQGVECVGQKLWGAAIRSPTMYIYCSVELRRLSQMVLWNSYLHGTSNPHESYPPTR